MKTKRKIPLSAAGLLLVLLLVLLTGCDPAISASDLKKGMVFRSLITYELERKYGVQFKNATAPTVTIAYENETGMRKNAVFRLDGYDAEKKIGYKVVLKTDYEKWEKELEAGSVEAPDMDDAAIIQERALHYAYPVIFLWAHHLQDAADHDEAQENYRQFDYAFLELLEKPEIMQWYKALPK